MFQLDGKKSDVSTIAQSLLDNSGLFDLDPKNPAPTCVVYREDCVHHYLFVAAHAGLKQKEPMYGPIVADDQRRQQMRDQHREPPASNVLGFTKREGVKVEEAHKKFFEGKQWQIWLNARSKKRDPIERFEKTLLPTLKTLLESSANDKPLFSELWNWERGARERLHDQFRYLPPGASLHQVGVSLTNQLQDAISDLPGNLHACIGIYLDTGSNWTLLGEHEIPGRLPRIIEIGYDLATLEETEVESGAKELSAFSWVHWSTRPVLLSDPLSEVWERRVRACGHGFAKEISGACIVPLLDLNAPCRSKGVVFMSSTASQPRLLPAHVFLLSRMARDLSGFIVPLLPLPGFGWWPDVGMSRGRVKSFQWPDGRPSELPEFLAKKGSEPRTSPESVGYVEQILDEIMPTNSRVTVRKLAAGFSGAQVFQIGVTDQNETIEIPRVLKIGDERTISRELRAYYEFVHNKRLGVAARVDVARLNATKSCPEGIGAVVYTLVGSGDEALPWSEWAPTADWKEVLGALGKLKDQLWIWYSNTRGVSRSAVDLLIKEPFFPDWPNETPSLVDHVKNFTKEAPSIDDVRNELVRLVKETPGGRTSTCVAHGDLHCRNVFSVLAKDSTPRVADVALIDWGCVSAGQHPLTDISRLLADLIYKVRWRQDSDQRAAWEREREQALLQISDWAPTKTLDQPDDWYLAMIHQLAKLLFYRSETVETEPYLHGRVRQKAWSDLRNWVKKYIRAARK